jgi:hypothetical protein
MRTLLATITAALLLFPAAASAATTASATTTTGETLTVSIGYPGDGGVEYGRTTAFIQGAATLRGGSGPTTSVARIAVGFGDAYGAPGSIYVGDAHREYEGWSSDGQIAYEGTRKLYITAIADDGTTATANVTLTLEPKKRTKLAAFGALYDWHFPSGTQPALRANLKYDDSIGFGSWTPVNGGHVVFYVGTESVCDVITSKWGDAVCTDPLALFKAVEAGGYEARYTGNASTLPSSDSAGLIEQKP